MTRAIVVLCGLWLCTTRVLALYEDQAGTYDWYKPYVGHISTAAFHKTKPRVYVATEQGVVGALNLKDGSVAFRQRPADDSTAQGQLIYGSSAAFVSVVGSAVHAWDHADGSMKWTTTLASTQKAAHAPVIGAVKDSDAMVAVLAVGTLTTLSVASGELLQTAELDEGAKQAPVALVYAASPDSITACTLTPGGSVVHLTTIDGQQSVVEAPLPLSGVAVLGTAGLLVFTHDYSHVCVRSSDGVSAIHCEQLDKLWGPTVGDARVQAVATSFGWAVSSGNPDHPAAALLTYRDGVVSTIESFTTASALSATYTAAIGEIMAVISVQADGSVIVNYVLTSSGQVVATDGPIKGARSGRLAPGISAPGVRTAAVGTFKKRDHNEGYRSLLVWQDERIALVQQGVTVWGRDEALGGVTTALFSDLPPGKKAAAGVAAQIDGSETKALRWQDKLAEFAHHQLLNAKVQFKIASSDEVAELHRIRAEISDKTLPTRDARGFRRSIVVATTSGKLVALHNGDGHVLWSRPGPAGRQGKKAAVQHILPWRTYHDLNSAPQIATLTRAADATATVLSVLDVYTGRQLESVTLPYAVDKLLRLGRLEEGHTAEQEQYLAVVLPASGAAPVVHLLPDTPLARSHFVSHSRSIYFFVDGAAAGPDAAFRGYGFDAAAAVTMEESGTATAVPVWSLSFPAPVLNWAVIDPLEPVHTSVKVLGDRSMKYRYLDPNTMAVVTGSPGSSADGSAGAFATIYVVNTVTGAVRHVQTAPSCSGPATLAVTENMVIVQLWDTAASRFSVTSLELYDSSERTFSVLDHLFNPNATAPQSSWDPPPLEVPTLSFFTRTPSAAFVMTRTRAGITSKMLIQLTHTEQVYAMDMRFLDPRRPMTQKLTAEEQEEKLIPYFDTLPLVPPMFASYNKKIFGLKAAISAPSRLESTSLLFSYGIDLQYTRLSPAKNFDSLDDDFSYGLLIVALVSLALGSAFLHFYTKKSLLAQHWQ